MIDLLRIFVLLVLVAVRADTQGCNCKIMLFF